MANKVKILLVDDHVLFRSGVGALLADEIGLEVIDEAGDGEEAIEKARKLKPDVVVMDLSMPGTNGLDALRRLTALGSGVRVLILTMHEPEEYLLTALDAGAAGFLSKTSADDELVQAIRTIARGDAYLPAGGAQLLLNRYRTASKPGSTTDALLNELSAREEEVLALTAEGFSSSEIGKKLFISPKTVDTYRTRIMKKLDIHHRSELVRFALKSGLLKDV
ncbi:MAG: response regulator [Longimicrobiales bacterium]